VNSVKSVDGIVVGYNKYRRVLDAANGDVDDQRLGIHLTILAALTNSGAFGRLACPEKSE
jgi:hypothetical protein